MKFQIYVTSYNAIYGSFAALPLFLIWLQLSWSIVLFGAEIAHAFPQSIVVDPKSSFLSRSAAQTRLLALGICHTVVQRFHRDEPSLSEDEIARRLALSPREAQEMIGMLIRARLLSRVQHADQDTALLQPARDSAHITVQDVVNALDNIDENPLFYDQHPNLANLSACLDAFQSRKDPGTTDTLLRDIDPAKCMETAPKDQP